MKEQILDIARRLGWTALFVVIGAFSHAHDDVHHADEPKGFAEFESALSESFYAFKAEFEAEEQKLLTDEVLGFQWATDGSSTLLSVYDVKGPAELGSEVYECLPGRTNSECDYVESKEHLAYTSPVRRYTPNHLQMGLIEALLWVDKNISSFATIRSAKIWQDDTIMQVIVTTPVGRLAMGCHFHGAGIDCHRQLSPGRGEPIF